MRVCIILITISLFLASFRIPTAPTPAVRVIGMDGLTELLNSRSDTTYFINFWATWCAPCVKELPDIEDLHREYAGQPVRFVLVSLDFPELLNDRVIPFVEKRGLEIETVLLNAPNENVWIPMVDSSWSGAIPATLIHRNNKRFFVEGKASKMKLNNALRSVLN